MRGAHQSSATQPRACHNSLLCQWLAAGSVPELGQPCSLMLGLEVPCRWSGGKNAPSAKASSSFARGNGVLIATKNTDPSALFVRGTPPRAFPTARVAVAVSAQGARNDILQKL